MLALVRFNFSVEQMYDPPGTITIRLKTLTPLWTGGATTGKVDRLRETGILGSMRWWFEVLVRGVGGCVSDSVGDDKGGLDLKQYNALSPEEKQDRLKLREAGLCDVSYLFGTTNWKRRFRLEIIDDRTLHDRSVLRLIELKDVGCENPHRKGNNKNPKWYFPDHERDKPRSGTFALKIVPLDSSFDPNIIAGLIQFMADWAALGSRPQMGFGIVELFDGRHDTRPLFDYLKELASDRTYPGYPSLKNCFFMRLKKKDGSKFKEEDTFLLKCDLRRQFGDEVIGSKARHCIMGSTDEKPVIASKIKMSRQYLENDISTIRFWGWIPVISPYPEPHGVWIPTREVRGIIDTFISNYEDYSIVVHECLERLTNNSTMGENAVVFLARLLGIAQLQEDHHA